MQIAVDRVSLRTKEVRLADIDSRHNVFPHGAFRLEHVTFSALPGVRFALVSCGGRNPQIDAMTPGTPEDAVHHAVFFGPLAMLRQEHHIVMQVGHNSWGYCAFTSPDPRVVESAPALAHFRFVWCGYFPTEAEAVAACRAIDALANPGEPK